MEPENTTPPEMSGNKKFFTVSLAVVLIVAVLALVYLFMQKDKPEQGAETAPITQEKKIYTQEEKEQILAWLAMSIPVDTRSQAEKERILQNLASKLPPDTLSDEEKLRRLRALEVSINQLN